MSEAPAADRTAARIVLEALLAAVVPIPQMTWFIDRASDEPLGEADRPGGVIHLAEIEFSRAEMGDVLLWTALVDIDLYEQSLIYDTISARHLSMAADTIARINADPVLEDMLQDWMPRGFSADADSVADLGCAVLTLELSWLTPFADWRTILGQSGPLT